MVRNMNTPTSWKFPFVFVSLLARGGDLPSDFQYAVDEEGGLGLCNEDFADKMKSMARYLSKERTELIKKYKCK